MKNFKGAIFDLDGTLLNSMHVWAEVNESFLQKRGLTAPSGYIEAITPMFSMEAANYAIETLNLADQPDALICEWDDMARTLYGSHVELKDGAMEYLLHLKEKGIKLAVATALQYDLFEPVLQHNDIYHLFDAFASLYEVKRNKSFPDIYLLASERIGVAPKDCMVFEDIVTGVLGAKAGGFSTCGVYEPWSFGEQAELKNTADFYICSFQELL